ncbi:hypothetical protein KIN20_028073 [Parelaphostrongylus tenuis]|uniref:Uncharacterized protein n=1 Tax=Parelaphostrongylus tenuis TaxID=148309 RepID=A0AAD5R0I4_PARTN|nr:hypothetical protein KIN20_028073 [Parelaphostrongylus tenuis]
MGHRVLSMRNQLDRVYAAFKEKYPTLIRRNTLLQQHHAKAHIAEKIKEKFAELEGIEVLSYSV